MLTAPQQSSSTHADTANENTPVFESHTVGIINRFIYPISSWQTHFQTIANIAFKQHSLITITGSVNSGKTTFIDTFVKKNQLLTEAYTFSADPKLDAEELLEILNSIFELTPSLRNDLDDCYQEQLNKIYQLPLRRLVIIDDAHQLSDSMLEVIFNVIQHQLSVKVATPSIQFILVGEPELHHKLQEIQTNLADSTPLQQIILQSLTLVETKDYLTAICQQHGIIHPSFPPQQLNKIYHLSEGYIGRLESVARQFILKYQQQHDMPNTIPRWYSKNFVKIIASSTLVLGMIAITGIGWIQYHSTQNTPPTESLSLPLPPSSQANTSISSSVTTTTSKEQELATTPTTSQNPSTTINAALDLLSTLEANDLPTPQQRLLPHISQASLYLFNKMDSSETSEIIAGTNEQDTDKPKSSQASRQETLVTSSLTETLAKPQIHKQNVPIPAVSTRQPSVDPIQDNLAVIDQVISVPKIQQLPQHPGSAPLLHSLKQYKLKYSRMEQEILATRPQVFTLQLIANSNEQSLKRFIETYQLEHRAWYYHTLRNHKDWYVLIYGRFNTREEAKKALRNLPPKLLAFQPWPRDYDSIQRSLKKGLT